jgi:RNA polymerase sigma factor (sigma-70 family)
MKLNKVTTLTEFYCSEYDKLVKRFSYRAGGIPNAEDVVQEAFTRALYYIDSYDPNNKVMEAWFNTIINNTLKDFKRQERYQGMVAEPDRIIEDLELAAHDEQTLEKIMLEVKDMDEPAKSILELFVFLGYQSKEVVQLLDVNLWTVRKCIQMFYDDMREKYA